MSESKLGERSRNSGAFYSPELTRGAKAGGCHKAVLRVSCYRLTVKIYKCLLSLLSILGFI